MKVVHINTYDGNGGAGRAVLRLHKGLKQLQVDSEVVCLYQFNPASGVTAVSRSLIGKLRAVFNIFAERYLVKFWLKDGSVPFSLQRFGIPPSSIKLLKDADIIHIHWVNHGFLSPSGIGNLARLNKKIFWSLHDANPITGGCHVRYGCPGFKHSCGNCPVLRNPGEKDLSHRTWLKKHRNYAKLNFTFIAPSTWMGECAEQASLSAGKQVRVISNALETDVFRPMDKALCRREFGIDENDQVILAGYMPSKSDKHKGFKELQETLRYLADHPSLDKGRLLLVFYGSDGSDVNFDVPVRHRFMGRINDDRVLVKLYSLADVFIFPSIEESMGYTALESLSCGTPVAAFDTSGVRDVVKNGMNGRLVPLYDTERLAEAVYQLLNEPDRETISKDARDWVVNNFSLEAIAKKHFHLYQEVLSEI